MNLIIFLFTRRFPPGRLQFTSSSSSGGIVSPDFLTPVFISVFLAVFLKPQYNRTVFFAHRRAHKYRRRFYNRVRKSHAECGVAVVVMTFA